MASALSAWPQERGSKETETFGSGTEITVMVHGSSRETLASVAMVKLLRGGSILSAQGETSDGRSVLVVKSLGEFTVLVQAAGYADAQKEISINGSGSTQVDVYLRPSSSTTATPGVPGRPLLAPKAQTAIDKGLQALGSDRAGEAEKFVDEAVRLAPGHPDVLYVQGVLRLKQHKWEQAESALAEATQLDPNHSRAFAALGMALCDQGKYEEAIAPLEKSLQLDAAGSWETRRTLAKAYYQHRQYDEALIMSREALTAAKSKAPEIALLVAQSLTATGLYDEAAGMLRNFLRDHSDSREATTARRWLDRLSASGKLTAKNQ